MSVSGLAWISATVYLKPTGGVLVFGNFYKVGQKSWETCNSHWGVRLLLQTIVLCEVIHASHLPVMQRKVKKIQINQYQKPYRLSLITIHMVLIKHSYTETFFY